MICSRCNKRVAVIFMSGADGKEGFTKGLCIQCAKEMGIKPVTNMLDNMGIDEEQLAMLEEEMQGMMGGEGMETGEDGDEGEGGRAMSLPNLFQNLFGENGIKNMGSFNLSADGNDPFSQAAQAAGDPFAFDSSKDESAKKESRKEKKERKTKEKETKYLSQYCLNLSEKARAGKIDNVLMRDAELARVVQILNRRQKNNPCLIGEAGVGKTAVAEGLAIKIAAGDVPAKLRDKEVYLLDLTALVAGTQFRGQFESRIKNLIEEIKRLGNIILVIDEVHTIVGAGDAEGSMSAANILKPALSRGEIQVIGATTFNEYRKTIEKDAALERRFQPVTVEEPSIETAVKIVDGIKKYYEKHHGVSIADETVRMAVTLSERYITDRYLPDKAIDLIDEGASLANIGDIVGNQIYLLEKELQALQELKEGYEPDGSEESFAEVARQKGEELRLQGEVEALKKEQKTVYVSVEQLAKVIELWTGIPASKIKESEYKKLAGLEQVLQNRIVGQDEAISALTRALKRSRVGVSPKHKPASFIFIGPTGVGKTELVKQLSVALFDSPETMIRLDMSEFMEKHSVSRIIGAPPGYVGYEEAGQLTEKVRRKPYSVVLFDEIEKAHPDVLNILLQILDDGRVTDAHGRMVSFESTVIIMTSNAGSDKREALVGFGTNADQRSKEKAMKALESFLRPEFINRIDEIVVFSPLAEESFVRIADIMLEDLAKNMERGGRKLVRGDGVSALLAKKTFSDKYGARNLRRGIEREVEDKIANLLIENNEKEIKAIKILAVGDDILVEEENPSV